MSKTRRTSESSFSSLLTSDSERNQNYNRKDGNQCIQKLKYLLMPKSKFLLSWEAFIFMAIWYNSVVTPIRLFILDVHSTPPILIYLDIAFDVIFVIDTLLHFYRPYIDKETGSVVTNLQQIRLKYLRSGTFYLNVISCVPILKGPIAPLFNEDTNMVLSTNFNVLRMIRVLHFPSQFQDLKMFLSQKQTINDSVFRMGIILFFTQLLMCILGSIYFGTAAARVDDICPDSDKFVEDIIGTEMWISKDFVITDVMNPNTCALHQECDDCPQSLFFARSVYFLMQTLFTIGYGDSVVPSRSNLELILVCFFMLFGVFGYGLIIANMTSVLSNIDVVNMRFRHEMDNLNKWMILRSVPNSLKEMIELHFSYLLRTQYGMLDDALFVDLPARLQKDLNNVAMDLVTKIPFFKPQYRTTSFLSKVADSLQRRIYPPGALILYEGEKQRELIIIKIGRVNLYVRASQEPVGTLVAGDYIGDYQLLYGTVNQVGAKAPEFVEVLTLTYLRFEQLMDHDYDFRVSGGNFRLSTDPGALETIEASKQFLDKIAKNVKNLSKKGNYQKIQKMLVVDDVKTNRFCIMPSNSINIYWGIFCLMAIIYYALSFPIRFALYFRGNNLKDAHEALFIIDYAIDALFIVDFILRLQFYAYVDFENGKNRVVVERDMIRKNYIRSNWFKVDRIAIIPLDILASIFGYHTIFRAPKVLRVTQIPNVVKRFQRNLDECLNISMTESQASGLVLLIYSILIVVWSSAGWNAIRSQEHWHESVYWALTTLTTVGYGDFTPSNFRETCYAIVIGAAGATFTAGIIANVTSYFHDVDVSEDNIDHKRNCVQRFLETHGCTLEQKKRIQEYFDYTQREQEGLNEDLLLQKAVPDHIRKSLLVHVTHSMIMNCSLFESCEAGFLREIMTSLKQRFFGSRTLILTSTMPADGMYFIKKGVVDLVKKDGSDDLKTIKRLEADDNFAEGCLLEHWHKNPYLAIAITDSELWFLSRSIFNRLIDDFPRVRAMMGSMIRKKDLNTRRKSVQYIAKAVERAKRKNSYFIYPDSIFIQCWFGLVLLIIVYDVIAIPFRVAFMENHNITNTWIILDYFGDTILVADILIRSLFLAYYDDNHLIIRRTEIWKNYFKSGKMKWHVLSLIPFEIYLLISPSFCPLWELQSWSLLRLNKVLRFVEMGYLINRVETSLAKVGVRVPKNAIRVGKLFMVIILSAHFVASIFFMIANFNQHSALQSPSNWAYDQGLIDITASCPGTPVATGKMIDRYVSALYWAMATLTTVGYGDITAHKNSILEIIFATLILVVGTAIYTLVIALLEDIVSQLDVTSSLHKMKMDKITKYIQSQGLPDNIRSKIEAYYELLWETQCGVRGHQLLEFLPNSFHTELTLGMLSPILHKTFFIKDCTADFIAYLLDRVSVDLYLPGDTLFREGERCNSLFFLYKGDVDLLTSKNVKFKTVSDCVVGEASFFGLEPHLCTAKTANQCELFTLQMEDFITCLHDNQLMQKYVRYLLENKCHLEQTKESITKMIKNLTSSKMEKMLVNNQETSIPSGVILPGSIYREIWELFALIFTLTFTFTIPYQISFSNKDITVSRFLIDALMDGFFAFDVYSQLNKFAVMKDGHLLSDPVEFRKLYLKGEFRGDFISILPISTIFFFIQIRDKRYGIFRLLQLTRVRRFGTYLDRFVEACKTRANVSISTAVMRIFQIFFIVLFLCHWFACTYHFIGVSSSSSITWLHKDESLSELMITRYIRSFFWALYTVTTIGYGSIPVVTNWERIFAMFVMASGAVICDAGITAVLTSIISTRDQQAGTNNRRIQCCKQYMKTYTIKDDIQERVLRFYNYNDIDLQNINETDIFLKLSCHLKNEVLNHFCLESLKQCPLMIGFSEGAVQSLVQMMNPYLAIPGEHLSIIGEPCESIFVLKSGMMNSIDTTGYLVGMPIGSIIGHTATASLTLKDGLPEKMIQISVISAQGLRGKVGHPYLIFKIGNYSTRSSVKKTKNWGEEIIMKIPKHTERNLHVVVKSWQKGQTHSTIGSTTVTINEGQSMEQNVVISDSNGRSVGTIKFRLSFHDLDSSELLESHEVTTMAKSYCHLYQIELWKFEELKQYFVASLKPNLEDRLSGPFLEYQQQHQVERSLSDRDRIKHCWRRPSRPSLYATTPLKSKSLLIERKFVNKKNRNDEIINEDLSSNHEDGNEIVGNNKQRLLRNNRLSRQKKFKIKSKNSASVLPESDVEEGIKDDEIEDGRSNWLSSNTIKTGTLTSERNLAIENSSSEELSLEELSTRDESWDVLVDLHNENDKPKSSRRATFFFEWTST